MGIMQNVHAYMYLTSKCMGIMRKEMHNYMYPTTKGLLNFLEISIPKLSVRAESSVPTSTYESREGDLAFQVLW